MHLHFSPRGILVIVSWEWLNANNISTQIKVSLLQSESTYIISNEVVDVHLFFIVMCYEKKKKKRNVEYKGKVEESFKKEQNL